MSHRDILDKYSDDDWDYWYYSWDWIDYYYNDGYGEYSEVIKIFRQSSEAASDFKYKGKPSVLDPYWYYDYPTYWDIFNDDWYDYDDWNYWYSYYYYFAYDLDYDGDIDWWGWYVSLNYINLTSNHKDILNGAY